MAGEAPTNVDKPEPRVGSYRLVKPLGAGGMSSVFRAVHDVSGHEVAVKVLPRTLARNPTMLQRFLREAKSAEALQHPNIVAIFDRGLDQGRHYIVLEFVAGGDLHDWVRSNSPVAVAEAIAIIRSVAEGLRYAAGEGLIHRDIKPANLLRTPEGRVKIADLGLALQAESEDERVTREGTTVGTVDYMAPEQARDSRATSLKSDIYSLGCTLFFLLTGQPPFPGGDVADKLHRHCHGPIPDPRDIRPDVPPALSRVVKTMLAKKPDARYADYDALIAALDALPEPGAPDDAPEPLYALIDDEDETDDLVPDDSLGFALGGPVKNGDQPTQGFTIAELAELDDVPAEPAGRDRRPPSNARPVPTLPAPPPALTATFADDDEDDDEVEGGMPAQVAFGPSRRMSAEEKSWIKRCVAAGVGLLLFVIAVHQLILASSDSNVPKPEVTSSGEADAPEAEGTGVVAPVAPAVPAKTAAPPKAPAKVADKTPAKAAPPRPSAPVWAEPGDVATTPAPEAKYDQATEARFRPDWAAVEPSPRSTGRRVVVRRAPDYNDPEQRSTLRLALEAKAETVELADDGPFFESDLRFVGDSRYVRGRPGYRPILCLEAPKQEGLSHQGAVVDLSEKSLTLDGLDLIVDVTDLPRTFGALFHLGGGATLTLRDCSVTVVNRGNLPFSVVATGAGAKPNRVRLERCLVRGLFVAAVAVGEGPAEVVVSRSVVLNGQGGLVASVGSTAPGRSVFVVRTVSATKGPAFEVGDAPRGRPLSARVFGSTLARWKSGTAGLVFLRGNVRAPDALDWSGDFNVLAGWGDLLSSGNDHTVRLRQLADARTVWPKTDRSSREQRDAWPSYAAFDHLVAAEFVKPAAGRKDVLDRVPAPNRYLHEKTFSTFPRPAVPGFPPRAGPAPVAGVNMSTGERVTVSPNPLPAAGPRLLPLTTPDRGVKPPTAPAPNDPNKAGRAAGVAEPGVRELAFDAEDPQWSGDLGAFLNGSVRPGDKLVRVRAGGRSSHAFSACKLPEGVSLEIEVATDPAGASPSWSAAPGAEGEALVDVRGASLVLRGVVLTRDGGTRLGGLVRVERGHLVVDRCRFTSPGMAVPGGGGLIRFSSPGTQPLATPDAGLAGFPFGSTVDRPTCRVTDSVLVTGGDAVAAELGRGVVAVGGCAVASGGTAFALNPGRVARDGLDADLWLDHCTLAAEKAFVGLGPWPGSDPGPDRPWVVHTEHCASFGTYTPTLDPALLRADAESLAHGALFWQSHADADEVTTFLAVAAKDGAAPSAGRSQDVVRDWVDLWRENHARLVTGPRPPRLLHSVRLHARLKPGEVDAGDLAIDPKSAQGRTADGLGADLGRLGIRGGARR